MKRRIIHVLLLVATSCADVEAISQAQPREQTPQRQTPATNAAGQTTGEDVFKANCSRCHMPPMSISPRVTGTIAMHMRTRARLSREDERKLMAYLAP